MDPRLPGAVLHPIPLRLVLCQHDMDGHRFVHDEKRNELADGSAAGRDELYESDK